jgi:hypothetical protein
MIVGLITRQTSTGPAGFKGLSTPAQFLDRSSQLSSISPFMEEKIDAHNSVAGNNQMIIDAKHRTERFRDD